MTQENKKQEKKEVENLKKTAEAKGTVSEEVDENATEKMIKQKEEEEKQAEEQKTQEEIKKMEEEERKQKEDKEKSEIEKKAEEAKKEKQGQKEQKTSTQSKKEKSEDKGLGETWEPITKLGREVKEGKIKNIDEILNRERKIMEPEIVDNLVNVKSELMSIGQSKGKFGGGKRRAWKQTQKKTEEGSVMTFSSMAIIGDEDGHIGLGVGRATETLPARDKALRKAKLNIMKIQRDCSSFDCSCSEKHSIPFEITGKSGGSKVVLMPAPLGTGLAVADELKKVLEMAGIKDVYSKTFGSTRTTFNLVKACMEALKKTNQNRKNHN